MSLITIEKKSNETEKKNSLSGSLAVTENTITVLAETVVTLDSGKLWSCSTRG